MNRADYYAAPSSSPKLGRWQPRRGMVIGAKLAEVCPEYADALDEFSGAISRNDPHAADAAWMRAVAAAKAFREGQG